ncbi:MAG TPA: BlaI/MecI/CopY family transcriptional regulator [Bryobacteraceae bacterium]|nr:BlaI/MecI/CopY family transcriptional regulator [Bryobacteraceae bacterium]
MAQAPRPTDGELEILRVLWSKGPATVREVHAVLSETKPGTGYTTVLKLLQIMSDKGLVSRDEKNKAHIYSSRVPEEQTQRQMVRDLLDRVFGGSSLRLVMQALSTHEASSEELAEIRHMLDEYEHRQGGV